MKRFVLRKPGQTELLSTVPSIISKTLSNPNSWVPVAALRDPLNPPTSIPEGWHIGPASLWRVALQLNTASFLTLVQFLVKQIHNLLSLLIYSNTQYCSRLTLSVKHLLVQIHAWDCLLPLTKVFRLCLCNIHSFWLCRWKRRKWVREDSPPLELALLSLRILPPVFFPL